MTDTTGLGDNEGGSIEVIRLRPAVRTDADVIAEVHIAARREAMPYLPVLHTDEETRDWVANFVLAQQVVWVGESEGRVVGYVSLDGPMLNDLYVLPGMQGQGAGSALLAKARELSPGELSLWTFQRNEQARRFYEQRGFRAVELTDGSGNEEGEPDVRYRWVAASRPDAGT